MNEIYLGLAIHNHQPVGNFPWVFDQVYHDAYLPMVELLEKRPAIRLSLHYSGILMDWMRAYQPKLIDRITKLVKRGQVEIMTGGYYEPILPSIPEEDSLGQIKKLTAAIQQELGYKANGLWLAERVWEPNLPKTLDKAEVQWTVVDDTHFKMVGFDDEDLFGCYITEDQGHKLKVFATSKYLRYSIPWRDVGDILNFLRQSATEKGPRIAVMGDDGEKFGSWPGSYELCWEQGWMDDFFATLEANDKWLHTIPLGEFARQFPPLGRVYLPNAAYDEMLEWALPPVKSYQLTKLIQELTEQGRNDIIRYMRGGFWRHFLVKYPEINNMHKKMMRVHHKVYKACQRSEGDCGLDDLWRGQCNCPYWHGIFGGIYMTDIRADTYRNLIKAENKADQVLQRETPWLRWEETDFDSDGSNELLVEGDALNLYLDPARGGSILEWDLRRHHYNLGCTLSRRLEAYHLALAERQSKGTPQGQEEGQRVTSIHEGIRVKDLEIYRKLNYDSYRRVSLIDHFLGADTRLQQFIAGSYSELGDFVEQPYLVKVMRNNERVTVVLSRDGYVRQGRKRLPFRVEKDISLVTGSEQIDIAYRLTNLSDVMINGLFASEWNFNLLGGGHNDQAYYEVPGIILDDWHLDSRGELSEVEEIRLGNRNLGIELCLKLNPPARLWRFPLEPVCNSETGLQLVYQGSCLAAMLQLALAAGEKLSWHLSWSILR